MAIIVETGEGLVNSNSFVTVEDMKLFAAARGIRLPNDDDQIATMLVKGADYLSLREQEFQGRRTNPLQALSFPRSGLTINCQPFPQDQIPEQVKNAQMQAVVELASLKKKDLSPSLTSYPVYREKVDVIERQFMTPRQLSTRPDGSGFTPEYPKIDAFLFFVLIGNECPGGGRGRFLKLVRA